ncbi:MAG: FKBP-type peptidyl-prolyl cis-trans isomerase [bacterium]|nr:FKBP-type peptidyl-prolyl cis-trans isomerase [bacterium]
MKLLSALSFFLLVTFVSYSQCESCKMLDDENSDYCFTHSEFDGFCIQFGAKSETFKFKGVKKTKEIKIGSVDDLSYLNSIASDKKLKLSATDILFIREALASWKVEERKYGYKYETSGLGIKMIEEGDGDLPENGKTVTVHYTGFLEDGTKFDSSKDRNQPFSFRLGQGQVIKGWDEGVSKLKIGSTAWLMIPPDLGYGTITRGPIPANSVLYFEIEVIESK